MLSMVGIKDNRRTQYTKKVIREAFIELLAEKNLQDITVTEITHKADINRGTFYNYYQDSIDLFQVIESELTAEILPLIKLRTSDNLVDWLQRFITILDKNKVISLTLLKNNTTSYLLETIFSEVRDLALAEFRRMFKEEDPRLLDYFFTYFVKGTIGTLVEWMSNEDGTTAADISLVIAKVLPSMGHSYFNDSI